MEKKTAITLDGKTISVELSEMQGIHLTDGSEVNVAVVKDEEGKVYVLDYGTYLKLQQAEESNDAFERTLKKMSALHKAKNSDYGNAFEENMDDFGVSYGVGRLYEKVKRAKSVLKKGKADVEDETLKDTIFDTAVYAVIVKSYMDKEG